MTPNPGRPVREAGCLRSRSASAPDAPISGCVKCGSDDISVSWHGQGADHITRQYAECRKYGRDRGEPAAEHLCCTCRVCQYRWKEDVLDALV